jgi:hypothetical protein
MKLDDDGSTSGNRPRKAGTRLAAIQLRVPLQTWSSAGHALQRSTASRFQPGVIHLAINVDLPDGLLAAHGSSSPGKEF